MDEAASPERECRLIHILVPKLLIGARGAWYALVVGLVALEQVAGVDLVGHIVEVVVPTVGDDGVCLGLELGEIVGYGAAEEVGLVEGGLVNDYGDALALEPLHHALDCGLAEVVGPGFHGQAVDAHNRFLDAVDKLQDLVGDEVLAGAVSLHDGLDEVLWHGRVVCK